MTETSLPWGGTTVGDFGPYTDDQWSDVWRKLFTRDRTTEGVFPDYLSELAVTNPAGLTIRVASGGAVVDGKFYDNTANVDFAGVAPGGGSNFYNVVLRKGFAAQTVRLALLGPNVVSPDTPTQSDGVTWEVSIATVEVTSGSVVTITDARSFCHYNTEIETAMIPDDGITTPKILDGAVTAAKVTDGSGSGLDADLLDGIEGAAYQNTLQTLPAVSDITLTTTPTLIPGMTASLAAGTYVITAAVPFQVTGSSGQFADIKLQAFVNGVLLFGEAHDQDDIDASGRLRKVTLHYTWYSTPPSTQTLEIRAAIESGATATVVTIWQIDKAYALKVT